jgi:hypothetical protein
MHVRKKIEQHLTLVPKPGVRPANTRVVKIRPYNGDPEKVGYRMSITLPRASWEPMEQVL